jgi:DNA primase
MSAVKNQYDIKGVLAATDIAMLIGENLDLVKHGADLWTRCPFHDEQTASFTVSPKKQFYHCFGCGAHGDALTWMREYHGLNFPQALEELAGRAGIGISAADSSEVVERQSKRMRVELESALTDELHVLLGAVGARVAFRGIPADVVSRYRHLQAPPDEPWEREYAAAQRIAKALYALYGAKA